MELPIKDLKPYKGEHPPEGVDKINLGAYWYLWFNERKLLVSPPTGADGIPLPNSETSFKAGHEISRSRHKAMMNGYIPRFQKNKIEDYGLLGQGSYGKVWRVKFEGSEMFALKQLPSSTSPDEIWKERDLLIQLKNKRIVNLIGAFHYGQMYLIFELCFCALNQKMVDLDEENKIRFTIQLAEAVEWIHSKNVIHCDLKPDNCLITSSNNIVVSDFGGAIQLENGLDNIRCPRNRGVFGYQDYEANKECLYSKASDIYSLGCIFYELRAGDFLLRYSCVFENKDQEKEEYLKAYEIGRISGISKLVWPYDGAERIPLYVRVNQAAIRLCSLITSMIQPRDTRITANEILTNGEMIAEMQTLVTNKWKLDNGETWVTKTVLIADQTQVLRPKSYATYDENVAYAGIYYDEDEMGVQAKSSPGLGKSLLSYETHVIANFIKRHQLEGLLVTGLASNNPTDLAATRWRILKELTAGFLGRQEIYPAAVGTGAIQKVDKQQQTEEEWQANPANQAVVYREEAECIPDTQNKGENATSCNKITEVSAGGSGHAASTGAPFKESSNEPESNQPINSGPQPPPSPTASGLQVFSLKQKTLDANRVDKKIKPSAVTSSATADESRNGTDGNQDEGQTGHRAPAQSQPLVQKLVLTHLDEPVVTAMKVLQPTKKAVALPPLFKQDIWPVPPLLPPNQGGVVPDPSLKLHFKTPFVPVVPRGTSTAINPRALTPVKQPTSTAAPSVMTLRSNDGENTMKFQALNQPNVFQCPTLPLSRPAFVVAKHGPGMAPESVHPVAMDTVVPTRSGVINEPATNLNSSRPISPMDKSPVPTALSDAPVQIAPVVKAVCQSSRPNNNTKNGTTSTSSKKRNANEKSRKKDNDNKGSASNQNNEKKKKTKDSKNKNEEPGTSEALVKSEEAKKNARGKRGERKRKNSSDGEDQNKKKSKKVLKPSKNLPDSSNESSDNEDKDGGDTILVTHYDCPHCQERFEDIELCTFHIKKDCEVKKQKKLAKKKAKKDKKHNK